MAGTQLKRRTRIATGLAGAVVAVGALAGCSQSDGDAPRQITMSGVGEATGTPDLLTARLSLQGHGADVSTALNQASTAARKVTDTLTAAGLSRTDIATTGVRLNPRYGDDRRIVDYTATESMTVRIKDLSKASQLLADAVNAGGDATRIDSVGFDIEDDAALKKVARDKAFSQARNHADQYAALSDGHLGAVLSVTESPTGDTGPAPRTFAAPAPAMADAVPLEPGEQSVQVAVTVVWQLD